MHYEIKNKIVWSKHKTNAFLCHEGYVDVQIYQPNETEEIFSDCAKTNTKASIIY